MHESEEWGQRRVVLNVRAVDQWVRSWAVMISDHEYPLQQSCQKWIHYVQKCSLIGPPTDAGKLESVLRY